MEEKKVEQAEPAVQVNEEMLARMEATAKRIELANKQYEIHKAAMEAAKVEKMLEGEGVAGGSKKKMSDAEYAEKVLKGEVPRD